MSNLIILNKIGANDPIFDVVVPANTKNGHLVVLGVQNADRTYASAAPAAVTTRSMVMVLDVPFSYESDKLENEHIIATGQVARAYTPVVGRVVSIPTVNITATAALAVGRVVVPRATFTQPECLNAVVGTEEVVYVIDELFTKVGVPMVKLRCVKSY